MMTNSKITFATGCSGIGAPEVAFESLGWKALWNCEIEPFPSAVLKYHWPDGLQYKAYGNSMCVNVIRWIGKQIEKEEQSHE
jgi:site-specific DNA-cytosine methylase